MGEEGRSLPEIEFLARNINDVIHVNIFVGLSISALQSACYNVALEVIFVISILSYF